MYPAITSVKPLENKLLLLEFDNCESRIFDMKPFLNQNAFKGLDNDVVFQTVRVSFDTIEWENAADIDPEVLYQMSSKIS